MSTLKYIVIDHQGIEFPIVFPMLLEHKVVAKGQDKVVAAGFCIYSGGKWFCSGKSLGLDKGSRPQDPKLLNDRFAT